MNPIYQHLPPGAQRDEAEYEHRMAEARATIKRIIDERDTAVAELAELRRRHDELVATLPTDEEADALGMILGSTRCGTFEPPTADSALAAMSKGVCPAWLYALVHRVKKADAKHPLDAPDSTAFREQEILDAEEHLAVVRQNLAIHGTWEAAMECEAAEAFVELAKGNKARFEDELLDIATVAMRWRRALVLRTAMEFIKGEET